MHIVAIWQNINHGILLLDVLKNKVNTELQGISSGYNHQYYYIIGIKKIVYFMIVFISLRFLKILLNVSIEL